MTETVMSRAEFDVIFAVALDSIEKWKLSSVLLHMRDVVGERVGSRRAARRPSVKRTKAEKREISNQKRIARKSTYDAYLTSETWHTLRGKILQRDKGKCLCCGSHATQVHHRSYAPKVMSGEDTSKLASICHLCHKKVHFHDTGTRVRKRDVDKRFVAMLLK